MKNWTISHSMLIMNKLNNINGKSSPYISKDILRHYYYQSDLRLGLGIFAIRRITCSFHACTTILSHFWYSKIKETFNQPRYGRVYNQKYSQILGCHNNLIIMIFYMMKQMKNSKTNKSNYN